MEFKLRYASNGEEYPYASGCSTKEYENKVAIACRRGIVFVIDVILIDCTLRPLALARAQRKVDGSTAANVGERFSTTSIKYEKALNGNRNYT